MDWQSIIGTAAALALGGLLVWRYQREEAARAAAPGAFYADVMDLIDGAHIVAPDGAGLSKLAGRYAGHAIQIEAVTDTLATRRLPALWLLATVLSPLPVKAKFDLMMRPAGHTTFSNFDLLPATIEHPAGFPEHAVVRTDDETAILPPHVVAPHLGLFDDRRAKELLITANGLRFVWLLAEADRARYGVFRQASFGDVILPSALAADLLDRLVALRQDILDWHQRAT